MTWIEDLSSEDRDGLMVLIQYTRVRKDHQKGYDIGFRINASLVDTMPFKTAVSVAKWIRGHGWKMVWKEVNWQGYIKFAFNHLAPTKPHLGQLKNMRLLRAYMGSAPKFEPPSRTPEQLDDLYRKVLRPELATTPVMARLGLRPRVKN